MVIPTKRLLLILLLGLPLSLFPLFHDDIGISLWLVGLGLILILLIGEYSMFPKAKEFTCSLEASVVYYTDGAEPIQVFVEVPGQLPIRAAYIFVVIDGPMDIEIPNKPVSLKLGSNSFSYPLKPLRRGVIEFQEIRLRLLGYLGLWWFQYHLPLNQKAKIVPNLKAVGKHALRFFSDPQFRAGLKVEKHRGEGSEFDSLREYLPGYDTRSIDWKASARRCKMYSREFRAERNHQVVLALDCGRLMAAEINGITKMDYAINSLLLLAYFAIKSGDQVGFMSFADKVTHYLKPQGNVATLDRISHECESIDYQFQETNFVIGMEYFLAQQKKRCLAIILTDFIDTISSELLKDYVGLLAKRHLVLFVALRDPFLDANLKPTPETLSDLHRQVSSYHLKDERFKLFAELRRLGIHCLDLLPHEVSIPLLNRYLEIRRREMI